MGDYMKRFYLIFAFSVLLLNACTVVERPYHGGTPVIVGGGSYSHPAIRYIDVCYQGNSLSVPESEWARYARQGAYQGQCATAPEHQYRPPPRHTPEEPVRDYRPPRHTPEPVRDYRPPRHKPEPVRDQPPPRHKPEPVRDQPPPRHKPEPVRDQRPQPSPPLTVPTIMLCHNGTTLNVPENQVKDYIRQGARYGSCPPPTQPNRPVKKPPDSGSATIMLCHNGTTLNVPENQAKDYIRQGARYGSCPPPTQPNRPVKTPPTIGMITLCHNGITLNIPENQVKDYIRQGARYGACTSNNTTPHPKPPIKTPPGGASERMITICHKGRDTLTLPESAIPAHLKHGDQYGACP
jgi:hypothetical protein